MRRGKFCPKCGKPTERLYDGLCSDCFMEKMKLPNIIPEKLVLGTCKICGNIFLKEKKFSSVESAVENFLEGILKRKDVESATYRITGNHLHITIKLKIAGLEKEIEKNLPLVNKTITCSFCNLRKSSYYNVTIQVRVPKDMKDKIVNEIEDQIQKINKKDSYSFISGKQELKEGVDLFVGSKGAASKSVKYIQRKYNAEIKISRKLYGLIEGKKSYRDTILVSIK